MLHKPAYCCNCGEKVDRIEWRIWNSRKFCELCETEFQFDEWWPRAAVFIILIFGFTGIGFHFTESNDRAVLSTTTLAPPQKRVSRNVFKKNSGDESMTPIPESGVVETFEQTEKPAPLVNLRTKVPVADVQAEDEPQEIYYCGAMTKKGTPCARRVKNGGRCWQHKNKPAH